MTIQKRLVRSNLAMLVIPARATGEQAELAFTDNGPGVPPEQLPRRSRALFEKNPIFL